jgi:predicted kinase
MLRAEFTRKCSSCDAKVILMPRVIVIGGSPGSGKSTLARGLRSALQAVWVDFGRLREFHLKLDWSNQSMAEESMTFENLIWILRNYLRHGYENVIVDDLRDERLRQIPDALAEADFQIVTLIVSDEEELRRRIVARSEGWTNCDLAVEWNRAVIGRAVVTGERKIDTAGKSAEMVLVEALSALGGEGRVAAPRN